MDLVWTTFGLSLGWAGIGLGLGWDWAEIASATGSSCEPSRRKASAFLTGVLSPPVTRSSASFARRAAGVSLAFRCGIRYLLRQPPVVEKAAGPLIIEHRPTGRHRDRDVRVQVDFGVQKVLVELLREPGAEILMLFNTLTVKGLQCEHAPALAEGLLECAE